MKYNKLIRDKVPDIIEGNGKTCKFHIAVENEYWDKLKQKLYEEIDEFMGCPSIEELADIQEVVNAIADLKFGRVEKLEEIRIGKLKKCGGFEKKMILDETDDK